MMIVKTEKNEGHSLYYSQIFRDFQRQKILIMKNPEFSTKIFLYFGEEPILSYP